MVEDRDQLVSMLHTERTRGFELQRQIDTLLCEVEALEATLGFVSLPDGTSVEETVLHTQYADIVLREYNGTAYEGNPQTHAMLLEEARTMTPLMVWQEIQIKLREPQPEPEPEVVVGPYEQKLADAYRDFLRETANEWTDAEHEQLLQDNDRAALTEMLHDCLKRRWMERLRRGGCSDQACEEAVAAMSTRDLWHTVQAHYRNTPGADLLDRRHLESKAYRMAEIISGGFDDYYAERYFTRLSNMSDQELRDEIAGMEADYSLKRQAYGQSVE